MPLQKQTIPVQLGSGVDTKTDPKQVIPGKMLVLENCTLETTKRYSKRTGFSQLADMGEACAGFLTLNNDLLAFGNETVKKYDASSDSFIDKSIHYRACNVSNQGLALNSSGLITHDMSQHSNGVRLYAWCDNSNTTYYQVFDSTTNGALTMPVQLTTHGYSVKTAVVGTYLIVVYENTTSGWLKFSAIDATNPTATAITDTITSSIDTTSHSFDVCTLGSFAYVTYYLTGTIIALRSIDSGLGMSTERQYGALNASYGLAIAADETDSRLWLVFCNTSNISYMVVNIDATFSAYLYATQIEALGTCESPVLLVDAGSATIFYNTYIDATGTNADGFFYMNYTKKAAADDTGTVSTAVFVRSVGVLSKPFTLSMNGVDTIHILLGYYGHSQGYGFLVNQYGNVVAKVGLNGIAQGYIRHTYDHLTGGAATTGAAPPEVTAISSTKFIIPTLEAVFFYAGFGTGLVGARQGITAVQFDFDSSLNYVPLEQSANAIMTGGLVTGYDGSTFAEYSFNTIPEPPNSLTRSYDSVTNNFPNGVYQYVVVAEWFDSQGNFHQSAVSEVASITISTSTTQIAVVIPTLRLTYKNQVILSLYRTAQDGDIFYRLIDTPSYSTVTNAQTGNDTTVDTITYNDSTPDASITSNQTLYTTGGELDNEAPPAADAIFQYRNRMIVVPSETPNTIWYSKSGLQGIPGVPVEFSSVLTQQINTYGGSVTCGVQIDDKCVLFKPNSIFFFAGDGPTASGAANDFTPAIQIPTDVGCPYPRSVTGFPNGAIFKSTKGWYQIDRSLNVSYVGADVESYNSSTVVSTTLIENQRQIRVMLDSGVCLVYNYFLNQWDVFTNYDGVYGSNYQDAFTFLKSTGELMQDTSSYNDDGAFIAQKLTTSWLSFGGLQGFQRVYKLIILGQYYSAHALRIKLQYDFNPNTFQTVVINPGELLAMTTYGDSTPYGAGTPFGDVSFADYPNYQFRIFTEIQKCEAIQVTIEEVQTTEIGQGFALSGISFEVGGEGGVFRLPATRSAG